MAATNATIGSIFDEIADWLELDQANPFRIRAYRSAARTVTAWPEPLSESTQGVKAFDALPGIGKDLAEKHGVLMAVCSDSHDVNGFANLRFGIGQARRGWLERGDVINTLPLRTLRARLAKTMTAASKEIP